MPANFKTIGLTAMALGNYLPWACHAQQATEYQSEAQSQKYDDTTTTNMIKKPWLQEYFPHPQNGASCRATKSNGRMCDPDHILSPVAFRKVEDALHVRWYTKQLKDRCLTAAARAQTEDERTEQQPQQETKEEEEQGLEIQVGVAVVQKMDLAPFSGNKNNKDLQERAAETFARYIHDSWGVGVQTESCGGAGILVFLSIQDRAVFISKGAALEDYLTDRRLDHVIDNMKEYLRAEQYDTAILGAVQDMMSYMEQGPPTSWENGIHFLANTIFPLLWIMTIVGTIGRAVWKDSRHRRDYARVASQLNEIDRARAEALQGQYRATSCPICLEDWELEENGGVATKGSDGEPIKLLRCGHCMDESCWAEWVTSGRGSITKCPICQQDVGGGDSSATHNNNNNTGQQQPRGRDDGTTNQRNQPQNQGDPNNALRNEFEDGNGEARLVRQYHRERNFRLARLGYRYPQIIRPAQLQRWTQPTYDGSLVRDPSFVQSNPAVARTGSSGGSGMRSGGFGGGSSSGGGRGGRW